MPHSGQSHPVSNYVTAVRYFLDGMCDGAQAPRPALYLRIACSFRLLDRILIVGMFLSMQGKNPIGESYDSCRIAVKVWIMSFITIPLSPGPAGTGAPNVIGCWVTWRGEWFCGAKSASEMPNPTGARYAHDLHAAAGLVLGSYLVAT